MKRLRIRIDKLNDGHVFITVFNSDDGLNWANCGNLVLSRAWYDQSPLAGRVPPEKVEVELELIAVVQP